MLSINLFEPNVSKSEIEAACSAIKSKFWASGSGIKNVEFFETSFRQYVGTKNCVSVNSGTAALHLALSLFDLHNKDVLVPSMTFVSTASTILMNGGKPVFVEVDPSTLCISVDDLKKKISKKSGAIVPVHFGGMPCNINAIQKIASQNNIPIIEDAAHACGATYKNAKIGSHSEIVCFSYHPVKNLAMLTGGSICLNSLKHKEFKKILEAERWCGIENRKGFHYDIKRMGWNYYMNEISAAIGLVQLKKLDKMNKIRKNITKTYYQKINLENKMPFSNECSYHLYWIRVKNRSQFMKKMKSKGIETGIHYNPIHLMSMFYKKNTKLEITEHIGKELVSIPMHTNLTKSDVDYVIENVNKFAN